MQQLGKVLVVSRYLELAWELLRVRKHLTFENILVDFPCNGWVEQIEEDGEDRRSGDRLASTIAFLQKAP
jgi:hypothetical protein